MAENFWLDKRVLITGATGFVGKHLIHKLQELGADVAITEMDKFVISAFYGLQKYRCNLCNYDDVNRVISRFQPDIVFHLAAQPIVDTALNAPLDTLETNIRGTYNLLEVCSRVGKNIQSFVHFSTDKVYGETTNESGSTELSPLSGIAHPYNASKLCGDILAQSYASFTGLPISIIRSGNIYGEGDTHFERLIPYVCKMLINSRDPILRSDGFLYRDYIYISDVIDALLSVASTRPIELEPNQIPRIYNLGSDSAYTVKDIVGKLVKISGADVHPEYTDSANLELKHQHMNYDKIKQELGWSPKVGIDDGLATTWRWYLETYYND